MWVVALASERVEIWLKCWFGKGERRGRERLGESGLAARCKLGDSLQRTVTGCWEGWGTGSRGKADSPSAQRRFWAAVTPPSLQLQREEIQTLCARCGDSARSTVDPWRCFAASCWRKSRGRRLVSLSVRSRARVLCPSSHHPFCKIPASYCPWQH